MVWLIFYYFHDLVKELESILLKLNILADENIPHTANIFGHLGKLTIKSGRAISNQDLKDKDILLIRSVTRVDSNLLQDTAISYIGTATIGTDHLDIDYLAANNIGFSNAPGCNAAAVVDYVLSAIFLLAEQQGFDPKDKVYGIVGVGNVGSRLQDRLTALGYKLLLNDPPRAENEAGFVSLSYLLAQADVICLHTPLIHRGKYPSWHLLSNSNLNLLKDKAILINAARGAVIDNKALKTTLTSKNNLSAVLDVWENEPIIDIELARKCSLISPHIAGYSIDGKIRGALMLYNSVCEFFNINKTLNQESLFPPVAAIETHNTKSISGIIQQVYDIQEDDKKLRETLELPKNKRGRAFDLLRKNYRYRRELSRYEIYSALYKNQLTAIGFK